MMPPTASLRALLSASIDYAGMFPPCSLDLATMLKNQAEYVRSREAWMLNACVVPVAQFTAAADYLAPFDLEHPLLLSALGPKTEAAEAFPEALAKTIEQIDFFRARNGEVVSIRQLEMALPPNPDLETLKDAQELVANLTAFWEAPPEAAGRTIDLIATHRAQSDWQTFGYKMRTGGVTPDAFPSSPQIARALVAPATHQVPIKFTAGLHHPIRQFRDEVKTKMHGFLNVLGAAVLAAEHRWDEKQTTQMLEDEEPGSFTFTDDYFTWRDWKIATDRIEARRKFVKSFGSCSFDEPREDLAALNFL